MVNVEGGIIAAEFIAEYTADRVETTAAVWMGQTFLCTRCHDHKFDPFTQKDFYSFKAFFSSVGEQGDGSQDSVKIPTPEIEGRVAPLQREGNALQDKLAKLSVADAACARGRPAGEAKLAWEPFEISKITAPQGKPKTASDARAFDLGLVNRESKPLVATVKVPAGKKITALRLECSTEADGARAILGRVFVQHAKKPIEMTGAVEGVCLKTTEADRVLQSGPKAKPNATLSPGPNKPPRRWCGSSRRHSRRKAANETLDFTITITSKRHETRGGVFHGCACGPARRREHARHRGEGPRQNARRGNEHPEREFQFSLAELKEMRREDRRPERAHRRHPQGAARRDRDERARAAEGHLHPHAGRVDKPGEKVTAATPPCSRRCHRTHRPTALASRAGC